MVDEAGLLDLGDAHDFDERYGEIFFREFVHRGNARRLVLETIRDDARRAWCARRSFQHSNGFDKLVLAASRRDRRVVLHIWADPGSGQATEPHNHRWDFVSYVISGRLRSITYEPGTSGEPEWSQYRYSSPGDTEHYSMEYVGNAGLYEVDRRDFGPGALYFQAHGKAHVAFPAEPNTVTLIIQGPVLSSNTDVYVVPAETAHGPVEREVSRFAESQLQELLAAAAAHLPGGPGNLGGSRR